MTLIPAAIRARAVKTAQNMSSIRHVFAIAWRTKPVACAAGIVLSLAMASVATGMALVQRWIIDESEHRTGRTETALAVAIAVGALAYSLNTVGIRLTNHVRVNIVARTALELGQEVLEDVASVPTIDHLERADHANRVERVGRGLESLAEYGWALLENCYALISLGLSAWLLASVQPLLVLLVAASVPALLLGARAQRIIRDANDAVTEELRHEMALHRLCLDPDAAREIRIAGSGPELGRRADELWETAARRRIGARRRATMLSIAGWLVYGGGIAGALLVTSRLVLSGRAGAGVLVMVISLSGQFRMQLALIRATYARVAAAGRTAEHYRWLRGYASGFGSRTGLPPERLSTAITVHGLGFAYPGAAEPVLRDIDLTLPAGSVIGLAGINGAGKSTLVKLLTGLHQPTSGHIAVDGVPLDSLDPAAWAARTSGVFQDFAKFQFPVRDTVGVGDLPRLNDLEEITSALARAKGDAVVATLPDGIDTQLGVEFEGLELSHGQWQRLALARGLMRERPLLLVLDEPTAALDPHAEHELFESFAQHAREVGARTGAVTVLVSHRFTTVSMTDHVIVLSGHGVLEQGSHEELLAAGGRYSELYTAQAAAYR